MAQSSRCCVRRGGLDRIALRSRRIVAAGALVTEGTTVPPRSMVMGSPARVKRPLTDGEVAMIREFADNYVRYRLDYQS